MPVWPARSSRPGPPRRATSAGSRRASPSSCSTSASAAWPASRPAPTRPSSPGSCRRRRFARASPRSPPASRTRPSRAATADGRHFARTTEVRRRAGAQGPRTRLRSGSSSTRSTARAAPSASRSARRSGHDALVMIDKVADGAGGRATVERYARDMRVLPLAAADPRRVPQREGTGRPDARRARDRLRRRRRLVRRLRRGDRDPHAGRGDAPGARPEVDGHRRGHRLQHRLRQHLPVQPVPRPVDELAVRERAGRRAGHPRALGPGRAIRSGACGSSAATGRCTTSASSRCRGWSRRAPTSRCSSSTRRSTRTPAARRRRRRFGGQVTKLSAFGHGAPRPTGAPQGARPDPDGPRRGRTWRRRRRPTSTTSIGRSWRPTHTPGLP